MGPNNYEEAERRIAEAKASGTTKLCLDNFGIKRLPKNLCALTALQHLSLSNCDRLTDVSGLSVLPCLQQIDLSLSLAKLLKAHLSGYSQRMDVSVLSTLASLQYLNLSGRNLQEVNGLNTLTGRLH